MTSKRKSENNYVGGKRGKIQNFKVWILSKYLTIIVITVIVLFFAVFHKDAFST